MSEIEASTDGTGEHGTGNNGSRSRAWCFTWNNYPTNAMAHLTHLFTGVALKWVFQQEVGEETGTPHIQGLVYFKHPQTKTRVRKLLKGCHIEVVGDLKAMIKYCSKAETRAGQCCAVGFKVNIVKDPMEGNLYIDAWHEYLISTID